MIIENLVFHAYLCLAKTLLYNHNHFFRATTPFVLFFKIDADCKSQWTKNRIFGWNARLFSGYSVYSVNRISLFCTPYLSQKGHVFPLDSGGEQILGKFYRGRGVHFL